MMVCWGVGVGGMIGEFCILRYAYISNISILQGLEPFQKFALGGGWWSKGILEFHFGPNLGLRLEAGTKLNKIRVIFKSVTKIGI